MNSNIYLDIYANDDSMLDMGKRKNSTDLGDQLREAFQASGLSMFALSKQSGVPYSGIHRFITGDRDLTLTSASKVAGVLELKLCKTGRAKGR